MGLEVCPGREATTEYGMGDEWTPCDPQEGAITVNVGDALMYWSDDKLKVGPAACLICNDIVWSFAYKWASSM